MTGQDLLENLTTLLKKDERLVSEDGDLLKNKVHELANKLDKDLLELLMSDDMLKEQFFVKAGKATVFDKDTFIDFVTSKDFLPDSYTAFANKIWLTNEHREPISKKEDVVLSWPYKDCVLEGGQTKEDTKRNEIFWNETLAPDEISRLFEPKVFTNAKRVDAKGEKKLKEFNTNEQGDIIDNLVVKGNNLLALHSLKERFAGKVKLIYIDPPFNTETDDFKYNDKFSHSSWLSFMKTRLQTARDLLTKDGSIYLHLDWHEVHYCKVLMDEIFGRDYFKNEIIWSYDFGGRSREMYPRKHENILFYTKSDAWTFNFDALPKLPYKGKIHEYRGEQDGKEEGKTPTDVWEIPIINTMAHENRDLDGQKPEELLKRIIEVSSDSGEVILDFFAGTGTTGVVAHKLNRQYILVEQIDDQIEMLKERLQGVILGTKEGISKAVDWKGGGDFVYLELAKWNQKFKEQIEQAGSKKKLQEFWKTLQEKAHLSYKVDLKKIDENAKEFVDLSLEDQKKFLVETLDQNHLYINYSDIDDKECGVSKEDKEVNKKFYG